MENSCKRAVADSMKVGPWGGPSGSSFVFPTKLGVIDGFYGRAGDGEGYVDAIGIYVKPFEDLLCPSQELIITNKVNEVLNIDVPREAGPWGGNSGKPFDDGIFTAIKHVYVHVGSGSIDAIQLLYQNKDGCSIMSKRHGGGLVDTIHRIKLDCSSEYLVGIMGFSGPIDGNGGSEALRSITFYSNKGKYGPFGPEIRKAFSSTLSNGKVVGFHGRSGVYLDAIGVHMEYF
ncbi:hypothetical protein EZV62_021400 [Acer yangbiense]|uniref:Jacalin-type lectin domain-containing protein n=1 Tax=Acer yangbiense TaxID=1000413 RepID=A0A5C7H5I2_9ROSI|nr:hypothetical protein EZV62_021400 [Acer yangbiense]